MLGARGCIAYDATTELTDSKGATMTGTGVYTITVAWQGIAATMRPPASLDLRPEPVSDSDADDATRRSSPRQCASPISKSP